MKNVLIGLLAILFLCACNITNTDKYQVVTSTDGAVYRLDKSSGKVWLIRGDKMDKIREYDFLLRIGNRYVCEDFYSFTYLGKGEVGDIKAGGPIKVDPSKVKIIK